MALTVISHRWTLGILSCLMTACGGETIDGPALPVILERTYSVADLIIIVRGEHPEVEWPDEDNLTQGSGPESWIGGPFRSADEAARDIRLRVSTRRSSNEQWSIEAIPGTQAIRVRGADLVHCDVQRRLNILRSTHYFPKLRGLPDRPIFVENPPHGCAQEAR